MRRPLQLVLSTIAVFALLFATSAATSAHERGTTFMQTKQAHGGASRTPRSSNLFFHGGQVETSPVVFLDFWGDWSGAGSAQTYVTSFFSGVGGSSWANSTTQYCQGVAIGTTQCGGSGTHVSNPPGIYGGSWNDNTSVPTSPTQSQIANEASRAASHFGFNSGADYMVLTPSGHSESGFGTQWCAYHSSSGNLSYAYVPYQPDAGVACGQDFVNSGGNGQFDGFSIVGGHEYAETVTDPFPNSGWLDGRGAENGDKCAWIAPGSGPGAAGNVRLSTGTFAAQSLWSNLVSGCVLTS